MNTLKEMNEPERSQNDMVSQQPLLSIEGEFLAHEAPNRLCRFQCISSFCRCYDIARIAELNSIGIEEFQVGLEHGEAFVNTQTAGK